MKVLIHAINGIGLGHVIRTSRIAGALTDLRPDTNVVFVTNTKYSAILQRQYKTYPLKRDTRAVREGRYSYTEYLAYNTMAIRKILLHERPDAVLFDSELNTALTHFCRENAIKTIYVLRIPTPDRFEEIKGDLALFDAVIVPHEEGDFPADQKNFLKTVPAAFVGPIVDGNTSSQHTKRDNLLITFGSGAGIPENVPLFSAVESFLKILREHHCMIHGRRMSVDIVTGPFYEGGCDLSGFPARLTTDSLIQDMYHAQVVIAGAGYNTIQEIVATRTPAVVVPLSRRWDDQFQRAHALEQKGCITVARDGIFEPVQDILKNWERYHEKFPLIRSGNRTAAESVLNVLGADHNRERA